MSEIITIIIIKTMIIILREPIPWQLQAKVFTEPP